MRYWVYLDNKVCGPFEKEKLAELANFNLSSLICPDNPGGAQANDWKEASTFPEVLAAFNSAPPPAQPRSPAAEASFAMTMRGTLIDAPPVDDPDAHPPAAGGKPLPGPAQYKGPAADSPFGLTMRGTIVEAPVIKEPVKGPPPASSPAPAGAVNSGASEPSRKLPAAGTPDRMRPVSENAARLEPNPQLEPLGKKLDQMGAMMSSIVDNQSQLLNRINRLESVITDMKALLFPSPPGK